MELWEQQRGVNKTSNWVVVVGGLSVCLGKWQRWDDVALSGCHHGEHTGEP